MEFGVVSTAGIAQKAVIPAIQKTDHRIRGIASRTADAAEEIAATFEIPHWYASYDKLFDNDQLDAVYIPLPNKLHVEWVKRAADAGLDVLCEKPLGVNTHEVSDLAEYCAARNITLMEGFMYRFHPRTRRANEIVSTELDDIIGFKSSFKYPLRNRPNDIRLNPDLHGGSLMDVGCYAINAARMFLGEPNAVTGVLHDSRNCGVNTNMTALLEYESGVCAIVESSFDTKKHQYYRVETENGWLETQTAFDIDRTAEAKLEYVIDGRRTTERFDPIDQYQKEIEHFAECISENKSPMTDAIDARKNMAVLDAIVESSSSNSWIEL